MGDEHRYVSDSLSEFSLLECRRSKATRKKSQYRRARRDQEEEWFPPKCVYHNKDGERGWPKVPCSRPPTSSASRVRTTILIFISTLTAVAEMAQAVTLPELLQSLDLVKLFQIQGRPA